MKNHDLMEYNFNEGKEFDGIMPVVAEKIGEIGQSDVIVPIFDNESNGAESLSVIDIEKSFE